ncbi:acyl-CoA dehydrogenase family protein [Mycetocola reblochoni]|uniref:Acyl-CoA dehydrogenase n=2 Tax=Mycetocola reblochoni TaxID=331618 RepID=A0A3L6ZVA9_9MICO|nr:acyl-CoA dehydrogenase family protein [Mycetocola reblochoni]RLP71002.1 acyl-CoA dehydrogenase [Mycetocola reblochoni]SJN23751.1 Acyl-CoA dehydrogenase; probable dibenzothiophene desulfurization enzyme [Mycetocola reblochoni REB411]
MPDRNALPSSPETDSDTLQRRYQPVFDRIGEESLDRERTRTLPYDQVRWLVDAGFGLLRVPVRLGGSGASLAQVFHLLSLLAEADPNVAHIWRNHLAFVEDRLGASPVDHRWIDRLRRGDVIGGGWTEAAGGTAATMRTRLTAADDGGRLLTGSKQYATGSLYADWLDVLSVDEDGRFAVALVRAAQEGVEVVDDWNGFGQRATGSGSVRYRDAAVDAADVYRAEERFSYQNLFYQQSLLSVLIGIARATRRDGVAALTARTRTHRQAVTERPADDPQLLQVIGRVSALVFAGESAGRRSAEAIDVVADAHRRGAVDEERRALRQGTLDNAAAQLVISDATLTATTLVFDALGASAVTDDLALDRHWRNARTVVSHNPRVYKERVLGDWLVNDADPTATQPAPAPAPRG